MTDAPVAAFPPLIVGTDVEAVKKIYRVPLIGTTVFVILLAFIAVLLTAMMASLSGFGLGVLTALPFLFMLSYMTFLAVQLAGTAAARAVPGNVVTLDATGLAAITPQGPIVLPWQAIASVELKKRGRHGIAIFRVFPGVTGENPGVQTTVKPALFRLLAKKGFRIGSAGIDVPVQTILDATAAFTGGRLVAR
jgi:hypothetical protein